MSNSALAARIAASCAISCALFSVAPAMAAQQETVDGVLHVQNSAEPEMGTVVVEPQRMWERGGEEDDIIFGVTGSILCDELGNSYVLDRQLSEIQVFDESGEWLRTIGREGEGPGEFQNAADMFFSVGGALGIMQTFPGKIVQMMLDGEPAGAYPLAREGFVAMQRARSLGDVLVMSGSGSNFADGKMVREGFLQIIAPDGEGGTSFADWSNEVDFATLEFQEVDLDGFGRHWTVGTQNRIFAAKNWNEYAITAWNSDGSVDRVIERAFEPVERDDEELEDAENRFMININGRDATTIVEKYGRSVNEIYPRPNGDIWVRTDQSTRDLPDGVLISLDEFNAEGVFTRRIDFRMPGDIDRDGISFSGDRLYVTKGFADAAATLRPGGGDDEEDESDEMAEPLSVISYRIDDGLLSSLEGK